VCFSTIEACISSAVLPQPAEPANGCVALLHENRTCTLILAIGVYTCVLSGLAIEVTTTIRNDYAIVASANVIHELGELPVLEDYWHDLLHNLTGLMLYALAGSYVLVNRTRRRRLDDQHDHVVGGMQRKKNRQHKRRVTRKINNCKPIIRRYSNNKKLFFIRANIIKNNNRLKTKKNRKIMNK
jgi:hypothetical protein